MLNGLVVNGLAVNGAFLLFIVSKCVLSYILYRGLHALRVFEVDKCHMEIVEKLLDAAALMCS